MRRSVCESGQERKQKNVFAQRPPTLSAKVIQFKQAHRRDTYDWSLQQVVLLMVMAGVTLLQCCEQTGRARSTVRRWRDWLHARTDSFAFFLRSRFPDMGRVSDPGAFWQQVMNTLSLAQAMAWLDKELIVP